MKSSESALPPAMTRPSSRAGRLRSGGLGGLTALSLGATLSIVLSSSRPAAAGGLLVAHERTDVPDALRGPELVAIRAADPSGEEAAAAADGRDETWWTGRAGERQWRWTATFRKPVHLGLVRAHFGVSAASGVPTAYRWEIRPSDPSEHLRIIASEAGAARCGTRSPEPTEGAAGEGDDEAEGWVPLAGAARTPPVTGEPLAQPTHGSWFADVEACGLRLIVDRTNAGPPVLREVEALESARDVLRGGRASDDGAWPGFRAADAIDGSYARRWAGEPGKTRWTLRVDLPEPQPVDRIRLVLGFDATSVPRPGGGRNYAVSWAPVHYTVEISDDGERFVPVATQPRRPDGAVQPIRRALVRWSDPRPIRAVRLVMVGATGNGGVPETGAVPVVREIAAYRSDDTHPILASPWILSVNANPTGQSKLTPGGELTNDAYHAKFLQSRFAPLLAPLAGDDRYARALGSHGEPLDAPSRDEAGVALESIEGDDAQLDAAFLAQSSPPPIVVLSGSNDWDYGIETGPDPTHAVRWHWDPLRGARDGGVGQLAAAVQARVAPFLGFCGGAQLLALLEASRLEPSTREDDLRVIDGVLRRTSGRPIRGFAQPLDVTRAWPTDPHSVRAKVAFVPDDPLFTDLAGPFARSTTQALPESHADAIRPDAFLPGGPLQRFELLATSTFCGPQVVAASPRDRVFPNPNGPGWCDTVPEAYRSRDRAWPVVGAQFHPEQRDFMVPAPGDPPESVADARLFFAAAYEAMVDAYVKLAP